jgi:hypothetical protein
LKEKLTTTIICLSITSVLSSYTKNIKCIVLIRLRGIDAHTWGGGGRGGNAQKIGHKMQ